jgi:Putative beta barrel porin-7 (BBP7)
MSRLARAAQIFSLALLAVLLCQAVVSADDDFDAQPRPAQRQYPGPRLRRSTPPGYARNAAMRRSVTNSDDSLPPPSGPPSAQNGPGPSPRGPAAPRRAIVDPISDQYGDEVMEGGPDDGANYGPSSGPYPYDDPYEPGYGASGPCGGNSCDMGSCYRCCKCGPPGRFWVRDEYLGFWTKGDSLPVLVTTSPTGTLPATETVFGGNTVNGGYRSGNWIQAGMWLDCCHNWGIQGDYFFLGQASTSFNQTSDGSPILARPYTDSNTGLPREELIANPNQVVGGVSVTDSTTFQSAGLNLLHNLCCQQGCCNTGDQGCGCCFQGQTCSRLDLIAGFRYYNLGDNLGVTENLTSISTSSGNPVGTMITVNDSFRTHNNFYGGTIGLMSTRYRDRWVYEGTAQVALGANRQTVSINGSTTFSLPGQTTVVSPGGLLALPSNIGSYSHTNFMAIPQVSLRLGYRLTPRVTAFVGYTFIYWGQVARAGDQVNTTVNPNLVPPASGTGASQPSFTLHEVNFWAQGITLGGQLNF